MNTNNIFKSAVAVFQINDSKVKKYTFEQNLKECIVKSLKQLKYT